MPFKFLLCTYFFCLSGFALLAQERQVNLSGRVRDNTGQPIPLVNIRLSDGRAGTISDSTGRYSLRIPAEQDIQVIFSHVQYQTRSISMKLAAGAEQLLDVQLSSKIRILKDIEVRSEDDKREEVSTVRLNPASLRQIPTPFGDFNQALASVGLGVSSNSELSSAYSVRGGNFEENLVYVNGIEVYRPFLVSAGQQEGLSFINPDLVGAVNFSSGGWQAKYGDKLSSVLSVTYKQSVRKAASASLGLLGGSAHVEGTSANGRFTYLSGLRYKASRYLLNTLETRGEYQPRFIDIQGYFSYRLNREIHEHRQTTLSVLTALARNRYDVLPQSRETDFGTLQQAIRLFVAFEGSERLSYDTRQIGVNLSRQFSRQFSSSLIFSALSTQEREFINQEGGYRLCDISTDISSPDFNRCIFVRGVASVFNYGRNLLAAQIYSLENTYNWKPDPVHRVETGWRLSYENINDVLAQYSFTDSAGFVSQGKRLFGELALQSLRFSAYAQHRWLIDDRQTLSYGARLSYWNINGQWLISPRVQYAWKLPTRADLVFNAAAGVYQQPPFYRELRNFSGELNTSLKAQSSVHLIAGMDWNFRQWDRPFKLIAEAYYKYLWNVIPYDMDNLRLRYYAVNNATASVTGADFRLSGEFIPGTESWFSLSVLSARELVEGSERGSIRRPTDQRITFSAYFEDYLPNNPSIRVNLRLLYGSGLPFGPPGFEQLRSIFGGRPYRRLDIGFSKVFSLREKGSPLESVWLGLDILNLPGINNVISYIWVQDFNNNQYAVPNGLSQRFFNLRAIVRY